jgi:hypothetical protein
MRCFQHRDYDAIAVCQNCGKATCADCCDDTGPAVACGADCAAEVQRSYDLKRQLMQSFGVGTRPPMPASVPTYFFFGMILLATGIYLSFTRPEVDYLTLAMAAVFFVMAGVTYKRYNDVCSSC